MRDPKKYCILTNNPLVPQCVPREYLVELHEELSLREILVKARDMVYAGHRLCTHPLAGSLKPNETPYKSVVLSREPGVMDMDEALLIAAAVETCDKFKPRGRRLTEETRRDFQLVDYTLLCGAMELDALAGLSNKQ